MPPRVLAERMGQFIHQFTCYGGYRPLGINLLFAGWDHRENRYDLYRVTPSGQCFVIFIMTFMKHSVISLIVLVKVVKPVKQKLRRIILLNVL